MCRLCSSNETLRLFLHGDPAAQGPRRAGSCGVHITTLSGSGHSLALTSLRANTPAFPP